MAMLHHMPALICTLDPSHHSVTDSLDDLLKVTDKKKSAKKVAPVTSSATAKGLFEVEGEGETEEVAGMGTDDIMKYIQQNQATDDDDLDLF